MEIVTIVAVVVMALLTGFMTYLVIKNNKEHLAEITKLKADFTDALKRATDSINGEGAAQTEIIKQKSAEEQAILRDVEQKVTYAVGAKLDAIERTAIRIHEDVHTNLKNIIFDNFPSREDKVKSRVMDKLTYAMKYAAHDEKYMGRLMQLLDVGDSIQGEVEAANHALRAETAAQNIQMSQNQQVRPTVQRVESPVYTAQEQAAQNTMPPEKSDEQPYVSFSSVADNSSELKITEITPDEADEQLRLIGELLNREPR